MNSSIPKESSYDYHDPYNLLAASLMFMVGVVGITCNFIVIFIFSKNPSERTSFNCICMARAIANFYILVVLFGMIFLPTTLSGYTPFLSLPVSSAIITNGLILYGINDHLIILVAMNRFFAMYFPTRYLKLCGLKVTLIFILLIFVYHASINLQELVIYLISGETCLVYFSPYSLTWEVEKKGDCNQFNGLVTVMVIVFSITTFFNLLTLWKVKTYYTTRKTTTSRAKEKKNIFLFFQTILQDFLYLLDLSFTYKFGRLIDHRLWTFLSGTLIWQFIHAIDGFIMVMFNERLSTLKLPRFKRPSAVSVTANKQTI